MKLSGDFRQRRSNWLAFVLPSRFAFGRGVATITSQFLYTLQAVKKWLAATKLEFSLEAATFQA
jgi:hypothetical protein